MSTRLRRLLITLSSCTILVGGAFAVSCATVSARGGRHDRTAVQPPTAAASPASAGSDSTSEQESESGSSGESSGAGATGSNGAGVGQSGGHTRHGKCSLSLEVSSTQVTTGETVTLLGHLVCPEGTSPAGETVTISERERAGEDSSFNDLEPVSTGEDGSFQLTTPALTARSLFVARSGLARRGARAIVSVTPKVTLEGPAAAGAQLATRDTPDATSPHSRFTFTGTVSLAPAGTRVALQCAYAASGEHWHTVAFGWVGAEGHYSFTHSFRSLGEVSVRVVAHPKGQLATASEPLAYQIIHP